MWRTLWNLINTALVLVVQKNDTKDQQNETPSPGWLFTNNYVVSNEIQEIGSFSGTNCPEALKFGKGPPEQSCTSPSDPNNLPPSELEQWFTKETFEDLFPKANLGWGGHACLPYSYEAFVIAARYFRRFGADSPNENYTRLENTRRDVAAFFAHAVQETGENDASLYQRMESVEKADNCFYRGGFYNWFEGGPTSSFLDPENPGYKPLDGQQCRTAGLYCASSPELDYWFPCSSPSKNDSILHTGCYFGRGAIQISYNYNYGQFQRWLDDRNISVDLLNEPNLIMTHMRPPLAMLASLWFYMTPQPPKPAMHDIVMGNWNAGAKNEQNGYWGPIFGPTSLVINNECNGEDEKTPGGPGESRRIKAFKWFSDYFRVPYGRQTHLSCKDMPEHLDQLRYAYSWQPDWANTWRPQPCDCAPALYGGIVPYFDPEYYPEEFVGLNERNRKRCAESIYDYPHMYNMHNGTSQCLNYPISL